jgi:Tfp pilus assembly protein FimV
MKMPTTLKHLGLMLLVSSFAVGCASTTEEAPQEPAPAPAPEPVAAPAPEPEVTSMNYEVVSGDNLWNISGKPTVYSDPYQWPLIYKANSDQIKDADLIYPGQVLAIDTQPSAADVDAAIQHAKTRGSWSLGVVEESDKAYLAQ